MAWARALLAAGGFTLAWAAAAGGPPSAIQQLGGARVHFDVPRDNATAAAAPRVRVNLTSIIQPPTLPAGSYHAAVSARTAMCKAPQARFPGQRWNETTGRFEANALAKAPAAPAPFGGAASIDAGGAQRRASDGLATAPAPTGAPPSTSPAPAIKVAPDGRRYKCCDNADCSPGSPSWAGDCDKQVDCRFIVCPPEHVAFPPRPPVVPECKSWMPEEEVCKCSCRCVCLYSPSGKVYWMPGEPPRVDPSTLKDV